MPVEHRRKACAPRRQHGASRRRSPVHSCAPAGARSSPSSAARSSRPSRDTGPSAPCSTRHIGQGCLLPLATRSGHRQIGTPSARVRNPRTARGHGDRRRRRSPAVNACAAPPHHRGPHRVRLRSHRPAAAPAGAIRTLLPWRGGPRCSPRGWRPARRRKHLVEQPAIRCRSSRRRWAVAAERGAAPRR